MSSLAGGQWTSVAEFMHLAWFKSRRLVISSPANHEVNANCKVSES